MTATTDKLQFLLGLQERHGGAIPFECWMREALYHETFGYYSANIRGIGRRGDFTTWPILHDSLGRAIARWALQSKPHGRWHLIEIGAGTGALAAAVLRAIGWWNRPKYHIVDISEPLQKEQRKRLGSGVTWHRTMTDAMRACDGEALIFSNELVDAFPCRIFQKQEAAVWRELALRIEDGCVSEVWRDVDAKDITSPAFAWDWPRGQRIEMQESFRLWCAEWRAAWKKGAMLTIDYGDTCPALYHRRPHGTLRAYAHHQRLEGREAYAGFGLRDLTVDVNFSDLQSWGGAEGGELIDLGEFLASQGVGSASPAFAAAAREFKTLVQHPAEVTGAGT